MTEQEWLTCTGPARMLEYIAQGGSKPNSKPVYTSADWVSRERKLRLFACACCRQVWNKLNCRVSREAVKAAERYADGEITFEQADVYHRKHEMRSDYDPCSHLVDICFYGGNSIASHYAARDREVPPAIQADLLRDIFGNPFRQLVIRGIGKCPNCSHSPCVCQNHWERGPGADWLSWNDGIIPQMAHAIYDWRSFHLMPELTDALEESGVDNQDILGHCRREIAHVRGCWLLDLLLGHNRNGPPA